MKKRILNLEYCQICDNETGRSGRGEDSIYATLNIGIPALNMQAGDELGPICEECAYVLNFIGFATFD